MKFSTLILCVLLTGCTSVITTMTSQDGSVVTVRERRILMAADEKDNSVLREADGSFIVGLKSSGEAGDTAMVNALATGIIAGMKAGALAAATSGQAP